MTTNTFRPVVSADYDAESARLTDAFNLSDASATKLTPSKVISAPDNDLLRDDAIVKDFGATWIIPEGNKGDSGLKMRLGYNNSLNDLTGNGRNASLGTGTVKYVNGQLGSAHDFDGLTHHVVTDHADLRLGALRSLFLWIRPTSKALDNNSHRTILGKSDDASNGYRMLIDAETGEFLVMLKLADETVIIGSTGGALTLDEVHLVGFVWNGTGTQLVYVDNVEYNQNYTLGGSGNYAPGDGNYASGDGNYSIEAGAGGFSDPVMLPTSPDLIIGRVDTAKGRFLGWEDDIRVYNRQLDVTERENLYKNGLMRIGSVKTNPFSSNMGQPI